MQNPATDSFTSVAPSDPVDLSPGRSLTRTVVLAAGAAIPAHTPMGRVTSSGAWIPSVSNANDGSEIPRGLLRVASGVRATTAPGEVFVHGKYNRALVPLGAWAAPALTEALFDRGVILEDVV